MFSHLKGTCDLLQEAYYEYKRTIRPLKEYETILPYSEEPFCKVVYKHFKLGQYAPGKLRII